MADAGWRDADDAARNGSDDVDGCDDHVMMTWVMINAT
jgi:hypothetical protein